MYKDHSVKSGRNPKREEILSLIEQSKKHSNNFGTLVRFVLFVRCLFLLTFGSKFGSIGLHVTIGSYERRNCCFCAVYSFSLCFER